MGEVIGGECVFDRYKCLDSWMPGCSNTFCNNMWEEVNLLCVLVVFNKKLEILMYIGDEVVTVMVKAFCELKDYLVKRFKEMVSV